GDARGDVGEAWALRGNRAARPTALGRGVVGPGPASVPVAGSGAKAPTPPGISAGLRCRAFRVRGYQPRSTPHPAPPSGSLLESAPHERDFGFVARALCVVNYIGSQSRSRDRA